MTKNKVNISFPQYIDPLENADFVDSVECGIEDEIYPIYYDEYEPDVTIRDYMKDITNTNVIGCICDLHAKIVGLGGVMNKVYSCSNYLTKVWYIFNGNNKLILDIDNKGQKEKCVVSNIRINKIVESVDEELRNIIKQYLYTPRYLLIPKDERESICMSWIDRVKQNGGDLGIIYMHDNQDIWLYKNVDDIIKFRVWYGTSEQSHTKGFISKIEVLEKSNNECVEQLKNIIYG